MKAVLQSINSISFPRGGILTSVLPTHLLDSNSSCLPLQFSTGGFRQSAIDPPGISHLLRFPEVFSLMSNKPVYFRGNENILFENMVLFSKQ